MKWIKVTEKTDKAVTRCIRVADIIELHHQGETTCLRYAGFLTTGERKLFETPITDDFQTIYQRLLASDEEAS